MNPNQKYNLRNNIIFYKNYETQKMCFLIIQIRKLQLNMCFNCRLKITLQINGKQKAADKQIFLQKGKSRKQQIISIDLQQKFDIVKLEDFKNNQIKIRFYTVSLTSKESQIRFHAEKLSLIEIKSSKKFVKKTLDAFSGEDSFIQFSIQFNQKIDSKYQLNHRNLFNLHDQYQIAVKQTSKTRIRQQLREDCIFPSKLMKRKSLMEKFSPQRPSLKMLSINRYHQHKGLSNNLKLGLNRVQSFQYFNQEQLDNEVNSILSQKTFKIQNKDKHIDQLHRQKQILGLERQRLKDQISELLSTIKNLTSKVDQQQKTRKDLESKIIEKDRQLKNKLKQEKIFQEQKRTFEESVKTKQRKLKELQNKLQFLTQNYKKRQNTLKIQIKNQSSKLSEIAHEKQRLEFEFQNMKKNAEQKSKIINQIHKKQIVEENQEVLLLRKKNLDQQRQIYKLMNTISQINLQKGHNLTKIRDLSTELANRQSKQSGFKDLISKQNIELNKLKNQNLYLSKYKQKQVMNEEKLNQVKKQIEKNMELMVSKQNQIKKLQKNVLSFEVTLKKLNDQNSLLRSEALNKKTQIKNIQSQKNNIVFECEKMKDMNLVLTQKLEDVFKKNQIQRQNFYNKEQNLKQKLTEGQKKMRQKQNLIFQLKEQCQKISHQKQILIKRAEEQQLRLKKKTQDLIRQHKSEIQRVEKDIQQKFKNKAQNITIEEERKWHQRQSQVRFQYDLKIQQLIRKNQENNHNAQELVFKTKQKAQIELKAKNKQCSEYLKQLQESKVEYSQLMKKIEQLTKQNSHLIKENYELSQKIIQKEQQIRCAIKQKQTQNQQLISQSEQNEKMTHELQRKIQVQKQQIDQIQKINNLLEDQKEQLLLQSSSLQQKVLELQQQIAIMTEQLQSKQEREANLKANKNQNDLESKVTTLEKMLDQKIKAIEQIQKQISILKQKQAHLLEITKNQLKTHCNGDQKKLFDISQKFQKFRKGLKISNDKPAVAAEVFKKMEKLEADLATQKLLAQTNFNQLKTKQIQIEGIKVKYHKYKDQNQKLQTQVEIAQKLAKKSKVQLQNVVIALGETKKQLALLQEQLVAKSIANGNSSKIGSLFVMIKESIRKLEAVAVSNGPNPTSKHNLQKSVIMQKSDSKKNLQPQNLGLNGSSKNNNIKDMMDTKSMINFNTKKGSGQKSAKKVFENKSNQLQIPNLNKKSSKKETVNLVQSKQEKTEDQNDSIKSSYSAIVQSTKTTKEKQKINANKGLLNIDSVKEDVKSNLSNSMMLIDPKKRTQSSFFDDRLGKSDGSAQFSELDSQKMILNESIFCENNDNRNKEKAQKNRNQSCKMIKIIELENLKESEIFPQINIQLAKSKQSSSNNSVILEQMSSNTKMSSPPSLVPTNNFIHDFTFV